MEQHQTNCLEAIRTINYINNFLIIFLRKKIQKAFEFGKAARLRKLGTLKKIFLMNIVYCFAT